MVFDIKWEYEIRKLSSDFFLSYPKSKYPEILTKQSRSYDVIIFETYNNYYVCVPFRSHIRHRWGKILRPSPDQHGIDYSKMIIIKDENYIDSLSIIDSAEMAAFRSNIATIHKEVFEYLNTYINHVNGTNPIPQKSFDRKYGKSTWPYFHEQLGL